MEDAVRVLILTFTVISLIYILSHQPARPEPRPEPIVVPYCDIAMEFTGELRGRRWREWGRTYGPCTLLDRYEEI